MVRKVNTYLFDEKKIYKELLTNFTYGRTKPFFFTRFRTFWEVNFFGNLKKTTDEWEGM